MGTIYEYLIANESDFRRARLPALYSDFRAQKTINPDGYSANIAAWTRGLANCALAGRAKTPDCDASLLVLNASHTLVQSLESDRYGPPLALGAVFREAADYGTLVPLQQFMSAPKNTSHKSTSTWSIHPTALIRWSLLQMGFGHSATGEEQLPGVFFVITPNIDVVSAALLSKLGACSTSVFERTFSRSHFKKVYKDILPGRELSDVDFEVLLRHLERDKGLVAFDKQVVRFKSSPADSTTITSEDAAIASLRELITDLEEQTSVLSSRIIQLETSARDAISKQSRVAALAILRSKKLVESNLEARYATLGQLQTVARNLEQAADQVQLVTVLKSSSIALKQLNGKIGNLDEVASLLEDLREDMGQVNEVAAMIGHAGAECGVDDSEIEKELNDLALQAQADKDEAVTKKEDADVQSSELLKERFAGVAPPSSSNPLPILDHDKTLRDGSDAGVPVEELRQMSLLEIDR